MSNNIEIFHESNSGMLVDNKINPLNKEVFEYLMTLPASSSRKEMYKAINRGLKALGTDINHFDFRLLKENVIRAIILKLNSTLAPTTLASIVTALKGVAKKLYNNKKLTTDEYLLIKDIKLPRGSRTGHGRMLKQKELSEIFSNLEQDNSLIALRDAAMFAVFVGCGLRCDELAKLTISDLTYKDDVLVFHIIGKGNKERFCPISQEVEEKLQEWLYQRGQDDLGPIFCHIHKTGNIIYKKLSTNGIWRICKLRAEQLNLRTWSPHDLRRTFASSLLSRGVDISTVKDLMGHSSILTTQIYDKRGFDKMAEAISKNHLF